VLRRTLLYMHARALVQQHTVVKTDVVWLRASQPAVMDGEAEMTKFPLFTNFYVRALVRRHPKNVQSHTLKFQGPWGVQGAAKIAHYSRLKRLNVLLIIFFHDYLIHTHTYTYTSLFPLIRAGASRQC